LVELGYIDPVEAAARCEVERRRLEKELRRAGELTTQGHSDEAVALLLEIAAERPSWVSPRQALAELYYRRGDWRKARAELEWLSERGVDSPRLATISAAIAIAGREFSSAVDELEYACHVEPGLARAKTLLGTACLRLGKFDAAEQWFHQAIEIEPSDAYALDGLAAIHLARRQFQDSAEWALQAVEHDMRLFRAHYHLGVALFHLGRPAEATAAMETCARLEPLRAAPYFWLSRIAERQLGDSRAAREHRQRGIAVVRKRRNRSIPG
jgi:tetratricopeptide (TPR) repeat protein